MLLIIISLVLSLINFPTSALAQAVDHGCPDEWLTFHDHCYLFGHDTAGVHFRDAEQYCKNNGGFLVHVEDVAQNTFLKDFAHRLPANLSYWIGMTDEVKEGDWVFHNSDTRPEFFDWAKGDPNNIAHGNNEDCVIFWNHALYKWADLPCTWLEQPLCERSTLDGPIIVVG